jgi:hypothetical protein
VSRFDCVAATPYNLTAVVSNSHTCAYKASNSCTDHARTVWVMYSDVGQRLECATRCT